MLQNVRHRPFAVRFELAQRKILSVRNSDSRCDAFEATVCDTYGHAYCSLASRYKREAGIGCRFA